MSLTIQASFAKRHWTTLGSRTASVAFCLLVGCYSNDRPLNDVPLGSAAGTTSMGGSDAGEPPAASGDAGSGKGGSQSAGAGGAAGNASAGTAGTSGGTVGSTAGSAGASGSGGDGTAGVAGSAGAAGTPSVPVGALCESSSGDGCDATQFCIDAVNDNCWADGQTGCAGFCAEAVPRPELPTTCEEGGCPEGFSCVSDPVDPRRRFCTGTLSCDAAAPCPEGFVCGADSICAPDKVACTGTVLCPINPGVCPPGYTHSVFNDCFGPCVPRESCACNTDSECLDRAASCDRIAGRCVIPKAPEPRCALPFVTGDCLAAMPVFAFVDGSCQPQTYGGCGGNDNRFSYLEECRARCEGQPVPHGCPDGHVLTALCLACGPADGCIHQQTLCAETCDETTECTSPYLWCYDGICAGSCV